MEEDAAGGGRLDVGSITIVCRLLRWICVSDLLSFKSTFEVVKVQGVVEVVKWGKELSEVSLMRVGLR